MGHQIDNRPFPAVDESSRLAYVEGELRRMSELLGYRLVPHSAEYDAIPAPVSYRPSGHAFARTNPGTSPETYANKMRARLVRQEIKKRRARDRFFPSDLFADPAWDLLLDLYAAFYEDRAISVSSACIASAVPATTALRWIKTLTDSGQIIRVPDEQDGRRVFVAISDKSREQLDAYFSEMEAG